MADQHIKIFVAGDAEAHRVVVPEDTDVETYFWERIHAGGVPGTHYTELGGAGLGPPRWVEVHHRSKGVRKFLSYDSIVSMALVR